MGQMIKIGFDESEIETLCDLLDSGAAVLENNVNFKDEQHLARFARRETARKLRRLAIRLNHALPETSPFKSKASK